MLQGSTAPLVETHDLVMFDLDGVVYVSGRAIEGVPEHLGRVRSAGVRPAFVTNNASRTPEAVCERLRGLGIEAHAGDVVTSAQAAAHLVKERYGTGTRVLALGGEGLVAALAAESLAVVATESELGGPDEVDVVVSGYGPAVRWRDIMQAATLVSRGVPYVATNADETIPTDQGPQPGHGVLVRTISGFAGVEPVVAGKPARPLLDETIRRVGGTHPLMVGDRLDTDIEGANNIGIGSLLVLTGVTGLNELVAARPEERPTYVSPDLGGLFEAHPQPETRDGRVRVGGWVVTAGEGRLDVAGGGSAGDWWRAVATAAWAHRDAGRGPVDTGLLVPPADVGGAPRR